MKTVNRSLLLARPRAPYIAWAAHQTGSSEDEVRADAGGRTFVYLIPAFSFENDLDTILSSLCDPVFNHALGQWNEEPESWPADRGLARFKEWFDVELLQEAVDIGDGPISSLG